MVEIIIKPEGMNGKVRQSFNTYQRHLEKGDVGKWKPRYNLEGITSFEEFTEVVVTEATRLVQEVYNENPPGQVEQIELKMPTSKKTGFHVAAAYMYGASTTTKGIFKLPITSILGLLNYTIKDSPEDKEFRRDMIKDSLNHEFRHHLDRRFLLYQGFMERVAKYVFHGEKEIDGRYGPYYNTNQWFCQYLMDLRSEGLAEFNRDLSFSSKTIGQRIGASPELSRLAFLNELQSQTETTAKVADYFAENEFVTWSDLVHNVEGSFEINNPLNLPDMFSPYTHGNNMFKVIALAEMQRQEIDLTERGEIPSDLHAEVTETVIAQQKFRDFFELFYRSAETIGLNDNQLIVSPELSDLVLQLEARHG